MQDALDSPLLRAKNHPVVHRPFVSTLPFLEDPDLHFLSPLAAWARNLEIVAVLGARVDGDG